MKIKLLKRLRKKAKKIYWIEVNPDGLFKSYEIKSRLTANADYIVDSSYDFERAYEILNKYRRLWIMRWVRNKKHSIGRYKLDI